MLEQNVYIMIDIGRREDILPGVCSLICVVALDASTLLTAEVMDDRSDRTVASPAACRIGLGDAV